MSNARRTQGFTLVELLLVAAMLGAVGLTIVATFAGGLKIFNRMESYTAAKADVLLALEKMERDLRNTFPLKGMDFVGDAKRMTFPAVRKDLTGKAQAQGALGSVSYYRDDSGDERVLSREEKIYVRAVKKESSGHGDIAALTPIEDIRFQYFSYDPEAEAYSWVNAWDKSKEREDQEEDGKAVKNVTALEDRPEDLPLGVRIKISYTDGGKTLALERTVFIKTAVSLNAAKVKARSEKRDLKGAGSEQ